MRWLADFTQATGAIGYDRSPVETAEDGNASKVRKVDKIEDS